MKYNWHFWVFGHQIQVVIAASNYNTAVKRMKKFQPNGKFKFQFGDKVYENRVALHKKESCNHSK